MPTRTDRQEAADALQKAFLVILIAQREAEQWEAEEWDEGDWDDSDTSSDSSDSSSSGSGWSSSSSSSDGSDLDEPTLAEQYVQGMAELYPEHYLNERREVPKTRSFMRLLLDVYKYERPAYFRSYLQINPDCFDALVTAITDDDVFHNNLNNVQMPVEEQLAIALYRFGHHGNSASHCVPTLCRRTHTLFYVLRHVSICVDLRLRPAMYVYAVVLVYMRLRLATRCRLRASTP
ncbi:hypothetical protein B0H13DRAFT_2533665 [Mycena leptocephala]|nr:hypothetical protein B0H13DRAFT_2533665 [Mycena leptocephala]